MCQLIYSCADNGEQDKQDTVVMEFAAISAINTASALKLTQKGDCDEKNQHLSVA